MEPKIEKKLFVSEIIASQLVSLNCLYSEQVTFHQQPMSSQAVPRFSMSIGETFSKWIDLAMIVEYDKGAVAKIWTVLGHVYHVSCRRVLFNGTFRHSSDYVFGIDNFEDTKSIKIIFFFKMVAIWSTFAKCMDKFRKSFLFTRYLHLNWYR